MLILAFQKGGVKCSSACPFYIEKGEVPGVADAPLKTHCRMTMNPWMVDCDLFDTHHIFKMRVSEEEWRTMQQSIGRKAKREIKPLPADHKEIHPVGWHWSHDKWRATKSSEVKLLNR